MWCVLQLTSLRKELESIEQQLQRTERLIHIADPDGWYNPHKAGNSSSIAAAKAAAEAKAAAKAALEAERQRRAEAVAKQRAGWAAAQVGCLSVVTRHWILRSSEGLWSALPSASTCSNHHVVPMRCLLCELLVYCRLRRLMHVPSPLVTIVLAVICHLSCLLGVGG